MLKAEISSKVEIKSSSYPILRKHKMDNRIAIWFSETDAFYFDEPFPFICQPSTEDVEEWWKDLPPGTQIIITQI